MMHGHTYIKNLLILTQCICTFLAILAINVSYFRTQHYLIGLSVTLV